MSVNDTILFLFYPTDYYSIMLQFLTIVLDNFCNANGLELASADDLLYDGNNELTQYQRTWLQQYVKVWDLVIDNDS